MKYLIILMIVFSLLFVQGCAIYSGQNSVSDKLYARNAIVAIPTFVGNIIGYTIGQIIILPFRMFMDNESIILKVSPVVSAILVGFCTGTPFVVPGLMFDENPLFTSPPLP